MKRIVIFCFALLFLASCHNYKKDAERLTVVRDSLANEAVIKDSSIVEYLNDFNEILVTLDSIKKVEKLVTVQSARGREMNYRQKKMILEDIDLLNKLIQDNKAQITALQKKLNQANYKIGNLNSTIVELERMVQNLEKQVEDKDTEIIALSKQVEKLTKNITVLNEKITVIETESAEKTSTIQKQTLELNKAYYAYGSFTELSENNVIERKGGVLGIGKSVTMKEDFNRDYFTEVDIREFDLIPLLVKKADVVSVHSAGSFHISGEKTADTLFIDNKAEFWKASKFLVIVTK
jgi:predicted RNase H-like nuclease (RuvC/YqgF family)